MRIAVQRKIDQIVGTFLCGILSLLYFPFVRRSTNPNPEKILVILLSEMGSLVLSAPMFAQLALKYPAASVYLLTFKRNREIVELMQLVPSEHICIINDASFLQFCADCVRGLIRLRREGIDTVIDCELFSRVSSLLSFFCGAGTRVGFHRHTQEGLFRGNFITRKVLYNPYSHISRQFLTLVAAIDSQTVPKAKSIDTAPVGALQRLEFSEEVVEEMRSRLKQTYHCPMDKKLVLLYPSGGLIPIRAWPMESYVTVAGKLLQAGYAVGIIGLQTDRQVAEAIAARLKSSECMNLAGFTKTMQDLLVLFNIASLLITNDGGPGHFTALTPIPAIILFGPETPVLYGSLSPKAVNMHRQLNCSPCLTAFNHRNSPCDGDNVCLRSIDPQEVMAKAFDLLETQ
ncbi:MAG: hypothetical protein AMJ54_09060 [Deltaproteobacteria bacterium SG8_13]|nr:MAG: hypothetical protein AMJ54_09060 [Deltaproteobacteria bacterium SG8_13]